MDNMCIIGLGYVGSAYVKSIKENNNIGSYVYGLDIIKQKVEDAEKIGSLHKVSTDASILKDNVGCMVICMNTKENKNGIDASNIKDFIIQNALPEMMIIIKSAVPVGFCEEISRLIPNDVIYCPEFLREGKRAVKDIQKKEIVYLGIDPYCELHCDTSKLMKWIRILYPNVRTITTATYEELEVMKLARNAYLAMRVSFFNEINRLCISKNIDADNVIEYMCGDGRIGDFYNTPSFGYGGYCLPKDTKELNRIANLPLLDAISKSNDLNILYHVNNIIRESQHTNRIVIYGIEFKEGTDNVKNSSMIEIIKLLEELLINGVIKNKVIKVVDVANCKYDIKSKYTEYISDNDILIEDFIVTPAWYSDTVYKTFGDMCKIYTPWGSV